MGNLKYQRGRVAPLVGCCLSQFDIQQTFRGIFRIASKLALPCPEAGRPAEPGVFECTDHSRVGFFVEQDLQPIFGEIIADDSPVERHVFIRLFRRYRPSPPDCRGEFSQFKKLVPLGVYRTFATFVEFPHIVDCLLH